MPTTLKKPMKNTKATEVAVAKKVTVEDVKAALSKDTTSPNASAIEFLQEACYTVEFEVSWFATQRKASKAEVESMLNVNDNSNEDEADADMLSVSLRLLDSKDPHIKKMNEAKAALQSYRDSVTIPSAQLPLTAVAANVTSTEEAGEKVTRFLKKKPGERIIMAGDVEKFDDYVSNVLIPNLLSAVAEANKHLPEIKANAKEKLKKRFDEKLFPEAFKVGVRGPVYGQVGVSAEFEKLCPTAAARLKEAAQQRYSDTIELAVADFATTFLNVVETAAEQLACKTQLNPSSDHELYKLKGGVLKDIRRNADSPQIPEGMVAITVEYLDGKVKMTEDFGPMTEEELSSLRPYESKERGKVYESTFEKLLDDMSRFEQIKTMLGETGKPLQGIVDEVRGLLKNAGSNASSITDQVKRSNFFRTAASKTLAAVSDKIADVINTLPVPKKPRRRAVSLLLSDD